ncbi:MAG: translation initiation factor IF-2 [Polyangiales bacterium]
MTKVRVYEMARELGLPQRELVQRIASMGIQVRNHMSVLEPIDVDRVRRAFDQGRAANLVEERIRPTVVLRRRRSEAKPPRATPEPTVPAPSPVAPPQATLPEVAVAAAKTTSVEAQLPTKTSTAGAAIAAPATDGERVDGPRADVSASPVPARPVPAREAAHPVPAARPSAPIAAPPVRRPATVPAASEAPRSRVVRPSQPAPASVRFAHAHLPPGVVARGKTVSEGAGPIDASVRSRIVSEHAASRVDTPRRRELGRAALGPAGRPQGRPGRKKAAPTKKGRQTEITVPSAQKRVIRIEDQVQLQTLAQRMSLKATDVLMKLMQLGMSGVHINSTLDTDTAKILASEFGYEVENVAVSEEDLVVAARGEFEDNESDRMSRPAVVTVMGHVDHGKTSLLDKIRSANVVSGEAGGITQHIGAYRVDTTEGPLVFLDTPGHEAFTSMRARGAQCTDIVILVCAADDGVMPQTKEAINHAKAAEVPIVVALNKIDKPDARPDQVKTALSSEGLQPEEWGGDTVFVECSAVTGQGIDKVLSSVALHAELLELRANPKVPAEGVVLEAYLDRGRGPVANVLVRQGTLRAGDYVVAGTAWGRVRALTDDRGRQTKEAGPATPVEVLGLSDMPAAGDPFTVVTEQKKAQEVAESRRKAPGARAAAVPRSLDKIYQMMQSGELHELKLVIKADVQGSVEALDKALTNLSTEKVKVNVIHNGVGGITENDVMLASASEAIIVGFNVRPAGQAGSVAKSENIDLRMYSVIYDAVDDVKAAMAGLLAPKLVDKDLGKAEVRATFTIPKVGTVAGCYVTEGKMLRNAKMRVVRDSVQVWQGNIASLRRFKDDAREVASGYECGIRLEGYNDVKEGDVFECFEVEEVAATL